MAADRAMPERLGKYELRGVLGKGAMGVVYNAWDPGIERRVAVKTIRLPDAGDETAEEEYGRFKREAQAAGRLSHPGIVGVYEAGEADGIAYIAMELVEGQSLKALLDAQHRLTPQEAVRVMRELLDALAYSHARGVIHRDIKPTNILVTPRGQLKITDFGIARIESSSMTQMGTVMGTPAYMSPEQFMGQTVDQRTDIYAAGVLLFQLLTGERPFEGGLTAIMHKVLHTTPPKPSDLSVTAPEAFDAVVAKAMARRPEDRYPSADAFSAALTEALTGAPTGAPAAPAAADAGWDSEATLVAPRPAPPRPAEPRPAAPQLPTPPAPGRRTTVAALAAGGVAVLAVLTGGTYWLVRPGAGGGSVTVASAPPGPAATGTGATRSVPAVVAPSPVPPAPVTPSPSPSPSPVAPTPAPRPAAAPGREATVSPPPVPPSPSPPVPSPPPVPPPAPAPASPGPTTALASVVPPISPTPPAPTPPMPTPPAPIPPAPAPLIPPGADTLAPLPQPTTQPATQSPVQPAAPPGETPAQTAAAALANVACTLLDVTGSADRLAVTGLTGAGTPDAAARAALARTPGLNWGATRFDGPYCSVVDTLRAIRSGNAPPFELGLRGGRTRLRNGETMAPVIKAPPYPAYLQLAYFQSNQVVVHLVPAPGGAPQGALAPGAAVPVGDPRTGGWPVGDPFGADMMVAIMSSAPLPPRPEEEPTDAYLAALERAAGQITRDGGTVSVRAVPIQTTK